ncbi:ABC transporter substrate-binding protein [Halorubrum lacusprofundi]|jgi:branched-chain amino acid transport system substrate-binding protein|uniref:Extracellular ligand-binding receptor n=1 Tax=Halorubrum lacusprofundi (strain ATCC 49239 / DSM 5036 / JCM 8891 / ACAM 34) TaxID=416348 RepID=B9LRL1_HALLT|nr:ABC transporter substrate-binding protein [Halorubrum lacusprofundi]ACM55834.1 Extracellular ligand-binding receptor [Halorubrum lacusprofundi ATCC 49239]MCG1006703.1 ABC transporter substrate-binding protein [Halorubrum lacusprofundi]
MVTASPDEENKRNRTRDIETNSESRSPVGRRRFLQAAGAGATVALAGCSGGSGDDDVVRLGATYILSGFASLYGEAAERGLEMAQSEINDNGGIDGRDVEVTVRDTEASADTAIQQMRSLVEEDNVHGLFGLDSSGVAQAVAPQAAQLQMPYMITHAATPFVTSPEGEHEDSVGNDYVFRDSNSLSQDIYGAALTAAELDATEWATIGPDYAFGYETWDYFQDFCAGLGVDAEFTAEQFPPLETGDYTPYISSILDAEPDAVLTPLWGADLTTFIGQAEDAGWFDQIDHTLFSVGMGTDLASDGNPLPEGEYASTRYDPFVPDTEANNTFRDTYYEEYDALPTYNAEGAYRAVYLYKEAIESAGSTEASALVEEFTGMEHAGPVGDYQFSETNQATVSSIWGTVSYDEEWESNVLDPVNRYEAGPDELSEALADSDLPTGI